MPFKVCHASNICKLQDDSLLVAWFAGEKEGSDDVAIWMSKNTKGVWSQPKKVAHDIKQPHWNPVIYQHEDGRVALFYKVGREIQTWYTNKRVSKDYGETWSEATELVANDRGGRGPVRCKIITLSDGSMLAGASIEEGIWSAFTDRSEDKGETWEKSEPITIDVEYHGENTATNSNIEVSEQSFFGRGVIQPTLWESEKGRVHMLLRSTEKKIYRADSVDYGRTWSKAYATQLPNNNSGIDVVKCSNGTLILCSNPIAENWGIRSPLTLAVSMDNGESWTEQVILEDKEGEFSYPSIISSEDKIYVTYTYDRKSIAFWEFSLEEAQ
ncbi:neuraminidase (sialidase) [Sporanaerobium hydrogeniformans]|uniref:Neuraminidase (Sialidase) n=2 Tax=Sporanaerobium hydrogeniformans TaxID=3072179 RepID=A0AC61DAM7_9FIRM|nr:neuraminidase (sialidase) [Sporanaerobium hydrogeniformans]